MKYYTQQAQKARLVFTCDMWYFIITIDNKFDKAKTVISFVA